MPSSPMTLEEVVKLADVDEVGQQIMLDAARNAMWTPEQLAEYYYKACLLTGRDPVLTICEMAYDL